MDRRCWLLHPEWMSVGWKLWLKSAPWERDFFLQVPTKTLDHWERYECKYPEATVFSQVLEAELSVNGEKLMCKGAPGRLWREQSELYGVSQAHQKVARCHRRMVARPVTGLRAHNTTTSQHHAVQSVQIVAGRSRNRVGWDGSGGRSDGPFGSATVQSCCRNWRTS